MPQAPSRALRRSRGFQGLHLWQKVPNPTCSQSLKCGATPVMGSDVCLAHGGKPDDLEKLDAEEEAEEQAVKLEYMKGTRDAKT